MVEERTTNLAAEVARLLPSVMRCLFSPDAEASPLWELPVPQMRALYLLRCREALTMSEVAGGLGVAMSTATQLADRLEKLGLVERRADPADRRVVRLALAEAGLAAIAAHARQRDQRIAAAMARLTGEERKAVVTGLRLLEGAAREGGGEPDRFGRSRLWEMVTAAMQSTAAEKVTGGASDDGE